MGTQYVCILALAVKAAGAIARQRFVTHGGVQAGAGVAALGVARTDAVAGQDLTVDVIGTAIVQAGAAIAAGAAVESNAQGQAVPLAAGVKLGRALQAAAAAGQAIEVLLIQS